VRNSGEGGKKSEGGKNARGNGEGGKGVAVGLAILAFVGVLAFVIGRCSAPDGDGDGDVADPSDPETIDTTPTTWAPDSPPNLITERPDAVLSALRDEFDVPIAIRRLVLYPEYAFAQVQDPANVRHLDEYNFRDGIIQGEPTPVAAGRYEDWRHEVFSLEIVKADVIRRVAEKSLEEMSDLEHPQVQYIEVARGYDEANSVWGGGEVELYVSISDPIRGGSGTIRTDAQGEVLEIHRS
jgi:hypothetical protein